MDDISWPVAIVLGLAAVYLVIALVNVYKKSEWPFVPSLEQTVKNAIEHAGYQNKRMPHLPEYVFNYQIEIDGLQANIYQTQAIDSMVFITADWGGPHVFDDWPDDKRRLFICDIISDLFRLRLEHDIRRNKENTGECGFRISAPIFCDGKSLSNEIIYDKVLSVIGMVRLMQLKWLHIGTKLDASADQT